MIPIKSSKEIEIMREGGRITAEIMRKLEQMVVPGTITRDLDKVVEDLVFKYGAQAAFKGYDGFPSALCVSVNNVIVHATPSNYYLKEGDIVSLDFGVKWKGFCTDMAVTLPVGNVSPEIIRMIKVAKKSLKLGLQKAKPGNTFGDVSNTIQRFVEYQGFGVVRELCGHGIGQGLHEDPKIPNYGKRKSGCKIEPGMVFCLEPMVTMGDWHLKKSADGFGYETVDGSLSCHFEHTIAITENGPEILTKL